jgi:prevent-host-death family protein
MPRLLPKTASARDIQKNYRSILDDVMETKKPVVILNNSKPEVVIIDINTYESLTQSVEEYELHLAMEAIAIAEEEKRKGTLKTLKSLKDLM